MGRSSPPTASKRVLREQRALTSTDDDGDGFTNIQEIGSAGTPPGNLIGSNPLNPFSKPEVCDGIDNDLNEGIDEGFPDTDNDGVKELRGYGR